MAVTEDPFATAPDEAQVEPVVEEQEVIEEPVEAVTVKKAPAKKAVGTVSVDVKPNILPATYEGKLTLTLKGGTGYDAPWLVVHATDLQDANDQLSGENARLLVDTMTKLQAAAKKFVELAPAKAQAAASTSPSGAPQGALSAPGGQTRQCKHGEMQFRSGVSAKTGKPWKAFFCPTPKDTPDQCPADFLR